MKQLILVFVLLLSLVIYPGTAFAHAIETDYQLVGDSLEIQSTFSTGEPFPNAPIIIYSPDDPTQPWLEGRTDENGKFVFNPERAISGDWSVEIGEDSHWDMLRVPVSDRGINLDTISYQDGHTPHRHYPFSEQFLVAGIALGSVIGSRFLSRKLRQ